MAKHSFKIIDKYTIICKNCGKSFTVEYKDWRKKIFERDNYRCRWCGECKYVQAHHIKSFAFFPELRYDTDNGITLCTKCHKKTDNYNQKARLLARSELSLQN